MRSTSLSTIREIHDRFDEGKATPTSLLREYLERIEKSDLNAFLTITREKALAQAREAESAIARNGGKVPREKFPLLGIPVGVKDNLVTEGVRTTCASKILENYVPPYTASAVARLERAGAVMVGKLNLDEFAMGGSNENSAFGPVKHPTHPDRVPGGSSGGSAAAVRAGLCVIALGSDTGGSIRLPASYCGVVGIKPTYGRVSRSGLVAFASSLDQVGPLATSAEDAAIALDVMSGHDPLDSTSSAKGPTQAARLIGAGASFKGVRVGVAREFLARGLDAPVKSAIEGAIEWLRESGAEIVDVELPHAKHSVAVYYLIAVSEASSNLARFDGIRYGVRPASAEEGDAITFYSRTRALFGPEVKRRILLGTFALSAGYAEAYYRKACQIRRKISQDFEAAFQRCDLIVGAVSPTTAFRQGDKIRDPLQMYLNDIFTIPANLAGLPALSVPIGPPSSSLGGESSLPIGLHLTGPRFSDERLLAWARAWETREGRA